MQYRQVCDVSEKFREINNLENSLQDINSTCIFQKIRRSLGYLHSTLLTWTDDTFVDRRWTDVPQTRWPSAAVIISRLATHNVDCGVLCSPYEWRLDSIVTRYSHCCTLRFRPTWLPGRRLRHADTVLCFAPLSMFYNIGYCRVCATSNWIIEYKCDP